MTPTTDTVNSASATARAHFAHIFRNLRMANRARLDGAAMTPLGWPDLPAGDAATRRLYTAACVALFPDAVRQFGAQAANNGTAPDRRQAIRLNLQAARYRRGNGYAVAQWRTRLALHPGGIAAGCGSLPGYDTSGTVAGMVTPRMVGGPDTVPMPRAAPWLDSL